MCHLLGTHVHLESCSIQWHFGVAHFFCINPQRVKNYPYLALLVSFINKQIQYIKILYRFTCVFASYYAKRYLPLYLAPPRSRVERRFLTSLRQSLQIRSPSPNHSPGGMATPKNYCGRHGAVVEPQPEIKPSEFISRGYVSFRECMGHNCSTGFRGEIEDVGWISESVLYVLWSVGHVGLREANM